MTEKIELFSQAWRFSPGWMMIDILCIVHFFTAWIMTWKKTGWKLDFWFFALSFSFLLPVLFMYPFNASIFNTISCGYNYSLLESNVDRAFAITLLGYASIWLGRFFYNVFKWESPFHYAIFLFNPMISIIEKNVKSKRVVLCLVFLTAVISAVIIGIEIYEDCLFYPRAYFLKNSLLRPIFNLSISILPFTITFLGLRYIQFNERVSKYLIVTLIALTLFFGLRSLTIGSIITVLVYRIFAKGGKISLLKLSLSALGLAFLSIFMDCLRQGQYDLLSSFAKFLVSIFYGNNLSDTRDFAWILAYWNGDYVYGKTYLAGLLSFFPRVISPFRQEWAISVYTNSLVNFDSEMHAGLRPGLFGEAFLNFSYIGVVLLGTSAGYMLRHADVKLKEAVSKQKDIIKGYSHTLAYAFISSFFITSGLWGFYVFLLLNLVLHLVYKFQGSRAANTSKL
jgi:hypothetical protein